MARIRNLNQRQGTYGDSALYDVLYKVQNALGYATRQGQLAGGEIQASSTVNVSNPVVRVRGTAAITTINAQDFGTPIYFYSLDGCSFSTRGGNIANDVVLGAGESAMAQFDAIKRKWFIFSGANGIATMSNVGGGAEVYKNTTIPVAYLRTLLAGTGIGIVQGANALTISNTSTATIGGSIANKQIAFGTAANTIGGEAGFEYDSATNTQTVDEVWFKRPIVNVEHFGAKGDGSTDDTDAIQSAYTYAVGIGGTLYLPAGTYIIGKTAGTGLHIENGVSIIGESEYKTILKWRPYSGGAVQNIAGSILNTTNYDINRTRFEFLKFEKDAGVTANVDGILGGCDYPHYNSGEGTFRNLWFAGLHYGVRGNGAGYTETGPNRTIGFFDCTFDSISYTDCDFGILTGGSGNVHVRPYFNSCQNAALVMDYISVESFSGEQFLGGTWTQNYNDIYFISGGGSRFQQYRQTNFFGSWFEASTAGIIAAAVAGIPIPVLNFQGCVLQTDGNTAGGVVLLDGSLVQGQMTVNECVVYQFDANDDTRILGGANVNLMIRDCVKFSPAGYPGMSFIGTDCGLHATQLGGQALPIGTTTIIWDNTGAAVGSFDRESCYDSGVTNTTYTVKYAGTYNIEARACIECGVAGGFANLRIIHGVNPIAITHHTYAANEVQHLVVTANINAAVGDTIIVSVYNTVAMAIIDNPAGFNNAHYTTWSVTREF